MLARHRTILIATLVGLTAALPIRAAFGAQRAVVLGAGHVLNVVDDFGAVADATGAVGVGTDDTAKLQAAVSIPNAIVYVPAGQFRITSPVIFAAGVQLSCAGRNNTTIWLDDPSGTSDGFVINGSSSTRYQLSIKHCQMIRTQVATAGALIHATDASEVHLEDNRLGNGGLLTSWDNVRLDCSGKNPIEEYFVNNDMEGAKNDDADLACSSATYAIADVFFEERNYFSSATRAAVELNGGVGWLHIDGMDFDQNPGTAILGNTAGGSSGNEAWISVHNSHFEGNGDDVNLNGFAFLDISGNEFLKGSGVTCTDCSQGVSSGNVYSNNAGLQLIGVQGWTESGSHWSTVDNMRPGMVQIGPSGTTPSQSISIIGGDLQFTGVPFLDFLGSANPATGVSLSVNAQQGTCWAGTNFYRPAFIYNCQGNLGPATSSMTTSGDFNFTAPGRTVMGNLYYQGGWKYYQNGEAGAVSMSNSPGHSLDFIWAPANVLGNDAAAGETVGGYVADDGSFQWGTSSPCGTGCAAIRKLQPTVLNMQGAAFPQRFTVATLPACTSSLYGALMEATDATSPAYNTAVTGGGSSLIPVMCSGSQWLAH